jgi:hypothetical protein
LLAGAVAAAGALGSPAHAATTCPAPAGAQPGLIAIDGRERLRWIDDHLDHEAARARWWGRGWAIGIGAAGLGSLAPVPFVAAGDRVDWYTGAVSAAIGVVPFLVSPLEVTRDAPALRASIGTMLETTIDASPRGDDARVCALLADAERKLLADAADERWQQGWWIHAGNVAFNTGVLLFLGLGYQHWTSGLINGISGVAVGEAIILTQPTGARDDASAYGRADLTMRRADARTSDRASTRTSRPTIWGYRLTF